MGFLSRIFGAKNASASKSDKDNKKKRWSFAKNSIRNKSLPLPLPPSAVTHFDPSNSLDANKHAIAVAAATAAVAEAALAAAHAAAEVVRLTSSTGVPGSSTRSRRAAHVGQPRLSVETAVVKIQSAFRRYLARRALKALKALVKLQALVRGHIVRKQTADMLRRMQTMVRLQVQARASRVHLSDNVHSHSYNSSSHYPVPEEHDHQLRAYGTKLDGSSILKRCSSNANFRNRESVRTRFGSKWLDHWMEENGLSQTRDDEKSDKILEVDTWKPQFNSHHSSNSFHSNESPSKRSTKGVPTSSSMKLTSRTADNSPQAFSASYRIGNGTRRGTLTPTGSECSWGYFNGYSGYPNYMANTESFNAKVRSQSVPRQRVEFDRYGSSRKAFQGVWEVGPNSDWDSDSVSKSKVSPSASSRLNRIGSTYLR